MSMTRVTEAKVEGLIAIRYLAEVPRRELASLAGRCRLRNVAKGTVLFAEGEPADGLFVVLRGRIKLVRNG